MKTLTKDMLVFAYQTGPVSGWEGDDGGFSVELYGNGNLRYCTYKLFDNIQLLQMFKLDRKTVYAVYDIIEKSREQLEKIPGRLDNGSSDGVMNEFCFLDCDRITAINIREEFIKGICLVNRSYYKEYKQNIKDENTVLKVFKEICKVLKTQSVDLTLESCEIWQDCKLKVTW